MILLWSPSAGNIIDAKPSLVIAVPVNDLASKPNTEPSVVYVSNNESSLFTPMALYNGASFGRADAFTSR